MSDSTRITIATRSDGDAPARTAEIQLPPELLARYRVGTRLGAGAMGTVHEATQLSTGRAVAIKFMIASGDEVATERFVREGRMLARLSHPVVLRVFDAGSAGGYPYLVTDLLGGGTLQRRLQQSGAMAVAEATSLALALLDGLAALHEAGIIHRDLKPDNIMFGAGGQPVIVDLGIGALLDASRALTRTGALVGTPAYMPPEQWQGESATPQSDIYAMGAILFEVLAGRRPFTAATIAALLAEVTQQPAPRLDELVAVPKELADAIAQALAKRPEQRPASARSFLDAIKAATGMATGALPVRPRSGGTPRPTGKRPRITRSSAVVPDRSGARSWRAGAAAAAVLLVAVAAAGWRNDRPAVQFAASPQSATPEPTLSAPPATPASPPATPASPPPVRRKRVRPRAAASPEPPPIAGPPPGLQLDRSRPLPTGARYRVGDAYLRATSMDPVALSSDGALIARVTGWRLSVWDRATRKHVRDVDLPGPVEELAFGPSGTRITVMHATPNEDAPPGTESTPWPPLSTGDALTGPFTGRMREPKPRTRSRIMGRWLVALGPGTRLDIEPLQGGPVRTVHLPDKCWRWSLSEDGKRLVVCDHGNVWLIDVETDRHIATFKAPPRAWLNDVVIAPRGDRAALVTMDLGVILVGLPEGQILARWPSFSTRDLAWSPGGTEFAAAIRATSWDSFRMFRVNATSGDQTPLAIPEGAVVFSGDGTWMAAPAGDGTAHVFRPAAPEPTRPFVTVHGVSPRARHLLIGGDGPMRLVDLLTGVSRPLVNQPPAAPELCAWSDDGARLALFVSESAAKKHVSVIETGSGRTESHWKTDSVFSLSMSADGESVGSAGYHGITIHELPEATALTFDAPHVRDLLLGPTLESAAVARPNWPVVTELATLASVVGSAASGAGEPPTRRVLAFSADGSRALLDGPGRVGLEIGPVPKLQPAVPLKGSTRARIACAAWSADGSAVAAALAGGAIGIWDARTGAAIRWLPSDQRVEFIALDAPSGRLVTVSEDGTALVWGLK